MKKIILSSILSIFVMSLFGQTNVALKINHKLGVNDFGLGAVGSNNLGQEFKATRLEYYVTRITVVHDGGIETEISDDVVALVRPEDEISTTIQLGSLDVETITSVKFHIGVYEPINNGDPTLFDVVHPLSPKSPSMHWGWAAGYRFIAYEGTGGEEFSQNFQLHGLGNDNYFEVESPVDVETVDDDLVMNVNGDYAAGLDNIDLTAGIISHGDYGPAKTVLENWRDLVFGLYYVGIDDINNDVNLKIFPNPTNKDIMVKFEGIDNVDHIDLYNPLGELIQQNVVTGNNQLAISILDSGIYFVSLYGADGAKLATRSVIVK